MYNNPGEGKGTEGPAINRLLDDMHVDGLNLW